MITRYYITSRYLKAAREYERRRYDNIQSSPSENETSPSIILTRSATIDAIAALADLHPNEVPGIALLLKGPVRRVERYKAWELDGYLARIPRIDPLPWTRHFIRRI